MKKIFRSDSDSLVKEEDTRYVLPLQDERQIRRIRTAVKRASRQARAAIRMDTAWLREFKKNYEQAYILYINSITKNRMPLRKYLYLMDLYHRSMEAGRRLYEAEMVCQRAIVMLLLRQSGSEQTLTDALEQCQSMISKLRKNILDSSSTLKNQLVGEGWFVR